MKRNELEFLGFKIKKHGDAYWFVLKYKNHLFITNDNFYNNYKDKWHIGYENTKHKNEDTFWFNNNIKNGEDFMNVFKALTGKEHPSWKGIGLLKCEKCGKYDASM